MTLSEPLIALLVAGSSLLSALLTVAVQAWLGGRNAKTSEVQTGLNALMAGIEAATTTAGTLNARLEAAEGKIVEIEKQAYRVLSENNRFRVIHGVLPATSLEGFEPIRQETWDDMIRRMDAREQRRQG